MVKGSKAPPSPSVGQKETKHSQTTSVESSLVFKRELKLSSRLCGKLTGLSAFEI
jgi:hypothetical protein